MPVLHKEAPDGVHGVACGQYTTVNKNTTTDDDAVTCKKCRWLLSERANRGQTVEFTDSETGEIQDEKPYKNEQHLAFGNEIVAQQRYVRTTLRDPEDPNAFAKLSPENIMEVLDHLSAYYDRLGAWLANQQLWLSDLKTQRELRFAEEYLKWKRKKGETNETARMEAKLAVGDLDKGIDKCKHIFDTVMAWKKSIGRYHDAARSSLSWEKQSAYMQRRNDNQINNNYRP